MQIQSLSICVPAKCCNRCKFCVAHMNNEIYINQIEKNTRFRDLYKNDFKKRLLFARDNGCNTVMLTGDGEPLLNKKFLEDFGEWNCGLEKPFRWIEIQTSGAMLDDEYLRFLRNSVGVNTISLSLSSVFSSTENALYNCPIHKKYEINIDVLCKEIKKYDFNLRLSLNMTDFYNKKDIEDIFERINQLNADQVTFRVLYVSGDDTVEDEWIREHKCEENVMKNIHTYIKRYGRPLEILPFGAIKYSVQGISTVIDDDCMNSTLSENLKYMILRPDCKLYSRWDEKCSLVF